MMGIGKIKRIPANGLFSTYKQYIESDIWKERRDIVLKENPFCERCGNTGWLNVHHINYDNVGNEKRRDLKVLCKICHDIEHEINK